MPSSSKTATLGLNQWVGTDIPKMEDYNNDNLALERLVGAHLTDETLHLNSELKNWLTARFASGGYEGNDANPRTIELGFRPTLVLVFALDQPVAYHQSGGNYIFSAVICPEGGTVGSEMTETGFTVYDASVMPPTGIAPKLNSSGTSYRYFAIR